MQARKLRKFEARAADRLVFFSDAVVAIAITLLALELPVPEGATVAAFRSAVREDLDHYTAFLISFVAIAAAWGQHNRAFRYTERTDERLRTVNACWLLTIVLNPFATKLLTTEGDDTDTVGLRFGFYALLQFLAHASVIAMERRMTAQQLRDPDVPPEMIEAGDPVLYGLLLGFGLSVPLFFATQYAWVLWIVVPVTAGRISRHRTRKATAD
ncbi:TMEM175 family protein [Streptomyces sp. NRRL B-24484]|uniref:TMEM175 family protein n=1 Tax=Streptomyces sp. NRRL B-24484 TaxID=1463833 RepID=UPI000694155E|nr:TMEM175 family protein [Streptomyces sp. NRRL B-24484]